jgi:hypothetical protein
VVPAAPKASIVFPKIPGNDFPKEQLPVSIALFRLIIIITIIIIITSIIIIIITNSMNYNYTIYITYSIKISYMQV